jgi:DNA polymerase-3 subunit alpha
MGFYDQAKKAGIKPLLGSEVYLVIDHKNTERPQHGRVDAEGGECKNTGLAGKIFHMGLIAQNNEGYANLVKIVSDAHINGFYYRPRTDLEHLRAHSKGLYAFSGCLAGVIPQHLVRGDEEGARKWVETFIEIFDKDHFVIELQDHGIPEQKRINPMLLKLAADYGLMAICSNDSHYVEASDFVAHDILLCIQTGAKLSDTDRFRFDRNVFYIKSPHRWRRYSATIPSCCRIRSKSRIAAGELRKLQQIPGLQDDRRRGRQIRATRRCCARFAKRASMTLGVDYAAKAR